MTFFRVLFWDHNVIFSILNSPSSMMILSSVMKIFKIQSTIYRPLKFVCKLKRRASKKCKLKNAAMENIKGSLKTPQGKDSEYFTFTIMTDTRENGDKTRKMEEEYITMNAEADTKGSIKMVRSRERVCTMIKMVHI